MVSQIALKQVEKFGFDAGGFESLAGLTVEISATVFDAWFTWLPKSPGKKEVGGAEYPAVDAPDEGREFVTMGGKFEMSDSVPSQFMSEIHVLGQERMFFESEGDLTSFVPGNVGEACFRDGAELGIPTIVLCAIDEQA